MSRLRDEGAGDCYSQSFCNNFANSPNPAYGTNGLPGVIRGPGFARTDLTFFKNFAATKTQQLQLRVEMFNALNQERFGQPGNQIGSPTFGVITTAEDGRIVQLGIKYTF